MKVYIEYIIAILENKYRRQELLRIDGDEE
jgi:hypothetical protein